MVAGAAGWGASQVLVPQADEQVAGDYTLVEVRSGEVGSSLELNVAARWRSQNSGTNRATGIVTGVDIEPGQLVNGGDVLYRVDERPVVIAEGAVPAFRDMGPGLKGDDVRQLQTMLADLGYLRSTPDGDFGTTTSAAVRLWQADLDVVDKGEVRLGDVIFVRGRLPARITLDQKMIQRDGRLGGEEAVLKTLPSEPMFTLPVTPPQAAMITDGTRVQITSPHGEKWIAAVASQSNAQGETVVLSLKGQGRSSICGDQCEQVPIEGESLLPSRVETTPTTQGLVVPTAALKSTGNGDTVVITPDGSEQDVDVVASALGMAVVTGVTEGEKLRVPAASQP